MKRPLSLLIFFLPFALLGCLQSAPTEAKFDALPLPEEDNLPDSAVIATLGGGCFWCVEEVFHQIPGVLSAVSGYMGGKESTANYEDVCSGRTEHAEVVQVHFDPEIISYEKLLEHFWKSHDPTQLNRQGPDRGPQYRSVIFTHSAEQATAATASKEALAASGAHGKKPIATQIAEEMTFYPAEDYHQNYARLNPGNRYLHAQLWPKLAKLGMIIPTGTATTEIKGSGAKPKP
ncbi:MAG: peptide-methionine (S)-S-oxide reductase MsrA [Verrucomicrobiota bacterium]